MGLKKLIKENVVNDIVETVKQVIAEAFELELSLFHTLTDKFEYIDAGSYAMVYEINKHPDKVIRISDTRTRPNNFEKIIGEKTKNVVKIYFDKWYRSIDFGVKEKVYIRITVMEKLVQKPLPINLKLEAIDEYLSLENFLYFDFDKIEDDEYIYDYIKDYDEYDYMEEYGSKEATYIINTIKKMENELLQIVNGLRELRDVGIEHDDLHQENILMDPKTKQLKIIDF